MIVAEKFPKLVKDIHIQIQEVSRSSKIHPKKPTPRQIIIKLLKTKDKENT